MVVLLYSLLATAGLICLGSSAPALPLSSNTANGSDLGPTLRFAASIGNVEAINALLRLEVDVNSRDESNGIGTVALHLAAWGGHAPAIDALLAAPGVQVDAMDTHNRTAMHYVVTRGPASAVKALVSAGAKLDVRSSQNWAPIHMAILANNSAVVDALIEAGTDVESQGGQYMVRPLHLSVIMRQGRVIDRLLPWTYKRADVNAGVAPLPGSVKTPISRPFIPIRGEPLNGWHTKTARQLLAAMAHEKPDVNANADIDHYDSLRDYKNTVQLLFESGKSDADPLAPITALNLATRLGDADLVWTLLRHDADHHAVDSNVWTVMHWAAYEGFTSVAQSLAAFRWNAVEAVNVADARDKLTPLHLAFQQGHTETAQYLIRVGANQQAKDALGRTPVQIAPTPIQL